jgi:release factor glutamine methyltransferase
MKRREVEVVAYRPMMPDSEARRRLAWQERVYKEHVKNKKRILMDFHGIKIIVPTNVFASVPWDINLLAQTVVREVKEADKVLDMGTGSGVQAILAASKSKDVTAVDVNPFAVKCAEQNVKLNKLSSRVKVIESDLFEKVEGRFDLIIFDPPFRWSEPRDLWERSSADKDYSTLNNFFVGAMEHLNEGGRIIMHFGTSGDIAYFKHLVRKNGFKRRQILKDNRKGWTYFTYRLTR